MKPASTEGSSSSWNTGQRSPGETGPRPARDTGRRRRPPPIDLHRDQEPARPGASAQEGACDRGCDRADREAHGELTVPTGIANHLWQIDAFFRGRVGIDPGIAEERAQRGHVRYLGSVDLQRASGAARTETGVSERVRRDHRDRTRGKAHSELSPNPHRVGK